ncbi:MAG: NAD(P)/FAD-dependent oxidoreductase [Gemmatirosa sp.]|nr:NAD(P)/FAD-dependent oxidoreductase [Gemmatirosa sp.]
MLTTRTSTPRRAPHVVVIGGGFGGLAAARALRHAPVTVTLVDRANHHLFRPLLYQVATAGLAPSDIAVPIRHVLRDQPNATVLLGDVRDVDVAGRRVLLAAPCEPATLSYDYLIVAAGSRHSYFGHDAWAADAPGLKTLADAVEIRRRLLDAFERAEVAPTPAAADAELTFVVVGGGPTGVELAGMIPELARGALRREFRRIDPRRARVLLVEAGPRLLPALPAPLGERARRDLAALGVDVRLGTRVDDVTPRAVRLRVDGVDERVSTSTVLWAAGNRASPLGISLARQAGVEPDRTGRVPVLADLSLAGHPELFVVGDLAVVAWPARGGTVPSVAPAAMQAGRRAGDNVARLVRSRATRPFAYVDKGELATIGKHRAVASLFGGRLRVAGWMAWWFWLALHIAYLIGFRNRLSVLLQWSYAYLFGDRGARLIIDDAPAQRPTPRPAAAA